MKKYSFQIAALILFFSVFYAVSPLFGRGYVPTHDGEYHIVRIVEFAKMLGQGYLFPRWAPDMNNGYGIPIFNYHYPLPNYVGSFLRIFSGDAVYAYQYSLALAYIAIVGGSLLWLIAMFGLFPALIGATVVAFVPYLFVDMYVRGSIGELWAIAFVFYSFYAIEKKKGFLVALSLALLILSHNILSMLFAPFVLIYAFIRNKKMIPWMIGGLCMSAFFWVPALVESKFVQGLNTVTYSDHFTDIASLLIPSWGTGFSQSYGNVMSTQIGIVPLLVMIGAFFTKGAMRKLAFFSVGLFIVLAVLMLPLSKPLWEFIKPLQLMQYPWRLLSFVVPISGFCTAYWVKNVKAKWVAFFIAALSIVFAASYTRPVIYSPRTETYYMARSNFAQGTSSMGNSFSTIWTGWINNRNPKDPIHTLYFPGWKVFVDGLEVPITNDHGIISAPIPPGKHVITKRLTETPIRLIADIISIGSLGLLILYAYSHRRNTR